MSPLRAGSLLGRSSLLLATLAAGPAWAQSADLAVKIDKTAANLPGDIAFGGTGDYLVTITNSGPSHASPATLGLGATALPAGAQVASVGGACVPVDPTGKNPLPCTIADLVNGGSETVKVTIAVAVPDPLPATCPANALGSLSLQVSLTAPATDPNLADDTDSAAITVAPFAELSATLDGPAFASVGDTIKYVSTVKNAGPCTSTNVKATVSGNTLLDNGLVSNEGDCTATAFPCVFDAIATGTTLTFTTTFKVTALPGATMSEGTIALPETITAASADVTDAGGQVTTPAVADPGDAQGTASATTNIPIKAQGGGCGSTGGFGVAGGLGLLLVLALRRRTRA
jgi:hypothetical protein